MLGVVWSLALLSAGTVSAGFTPPQHVEMERMKPRKDFAKMGRAHPEMEHEVVIAVQQHNLKFLEETLLERSTPGSENYQSWMSFDEIGALTSNEAGADSIRSWLADGGASVTWSSAHHDYIKATAPIAAWESMLHTEFHMWQKQGTPEADEITNAASFSPIPRADTYFLPESLKGEIHALFHVSHLPPKVHRTGRAVPSDRSTPSHAQPIKTTVNPLEGLMLRGHHSRASVLQKQQRRRVAAFEDSSPPFVANYYNFTGVMGSASMTQAVFETASEGYSQEDLTNFQQYYNLTVQDAIDVNGFNVTAEDCASTTDCYEGSLDIQYIMGLAQNVVSYYWYVPGNDPFTDFLVDISDAANPPLVNSVSWGSVEQYNYPSQMTAFNTEAMKVAAMGITVTVSSGDNGVVGNACDSGAGCTSNSGSDYSAWSGSNTWSGEGYFPSFPATSPYVVAVGGTMGPNYGNEEVVCTASGGGVITSGGGFSTFYAAPAFQTAAVNSYFSTVSPQPAPGYNIAGRAYPDVSMLATWYPVLINNSWVDLFGTSASSPVFAAMLSLLNSERLAQNQSSVGWINPTLYSASASYYMDVTSGNNSCCVASDPLYCCEAGFTATPGWDPATGFGSLDYPSLRTMFGVTADNQPTVAPTGAGMTSSPTYAPTIGPMVPSYLIATESNSPTCEAATSSNGVQNAVIFGGLMGVCVAYSPQASSTDDAVILANQSYINIATTNGGMYFIDSYVFPYSTNCTGQYTIEPGGSIPATGCYQLTDSSGDPMDLYLAYSMTYDTSVWMNQPQDGLATTTYDNGTQCTDGVTLPSTFQWTATGQCFSGTMFGNCGSDGSSALSVYANSECTGTASVVYPIPATTCGAASNDDDDDDDDGGDDDTYNLDYPRAETQYCYAGTTTTNSNGSSTSSLSSGEITAVVFACVFGVGVVYLIYAYIMGAGMFATATRRAEGAASKTEMSSSKGSLAAQDSNQY